MSQFNSIFSPLTNKLARLAGITLLAVAALFASTQQISAQSCVQNLSISIDGDCDMTITPSMVSLLGDNTTQYVMINDNSPADSFKINAVSPASGWTYGLFNKANGALICQGTIIVRDDKSPVFSAPQKAAWELIDTVVTWADNLDEIQSVTASFWGNSSDFRSKPAFGTGSRWYVGRPYMTDSCEYAGLAPGTLTVDSLWLIDADGNGRSITGTGLPAVGGPSADTVGSVQTGAFAPNFHTSRNLQVKVTDYLESPQCDDVNGYSHKLRRSWQFIDQRGNDTTLNQIIYFQRPELRGTNTEPTVSTSTAPFLSALDRGPGNLGQFGPFGTNPRRLSAPKYGEASNKNGITEISFANLGGDKMVSGTATVNNALVNHYSALGQTFRDTIFYQLGEGNSCYNFDATKANMKALLTTLYVAADTLPSGQQDSISLFSESLKSNYSVDFTYKEFPACNNGKKFEVITTVFDWCLGRQEFDTLIIKMEDVAPPVFAAYNAASTIKNGCGGPGATAAPCADSVIISVGLNDCTASLRLPGKDGSVTRNDLRDLSALFNWGVYDVCTAGSNLNRTGTGVTLNYKIQTRDAWNNDFFVDRTSYVDQNYTIAQMSGGPVALGLPIGEHRICIEAWDACSNQSYDTLYFDVQDMVAPTMKCDDQLNVTLTSNSTTNWYINGNGADVSNREVNEDQNARVYVADINEGSRDNCTLDSMYVRRRIDWATCSKYLVWNMDYDIFGNNNGVVDEGDFETITGSTLRYTPKYMQYVEVMCCDGASSTQVMVELWGSDLVQGTLGNSDNNAPAGRNWSFCWGNIQIEDKTAPVVTIPDLTKPYNTSNGYNGTTRPVRNWVYCTEKEIIGNPAIVDKNDPKSGDIANEDISNKLFGYPDIYGLECKGTVDYNVEKNLTCDTGYIDRVWTVTKVLGDNSTKEVKARQRIWVQAVHEYTITVPADVTTECINGLSTSLGAPTFNENGCDLLAMSTVRETVYDAAPGEDACKKIYRTWTIINWCEVPNQLTCGSADPMNYARVIPRLVRTTRGARGFSTRTSEYIYYTAGSELARSTSAQSILHKFSSASSNTDRIKGTNLVQPTSGLVTGLARPAATVSDAYNVRRAFTSAIPNPSVTAVPGNRFEVDDTWNLIGWTNNVKSEYAGSSIPSDCDSYGDRTFAWTYTQIVKLNDNTAPIVDIADKTSGRKFTATSVGESRWDATKGIFAIRGATNCTAKVQFNFTVSDVCNASGPFAIDAGSYISKEETPNVPVVSAPNTNLTISPEDPATDNKTFVVRADGLTHNPLTGKQVYHLVLTLRDDCGNVSTERIPFTVGDLKAPAPVCVQNLTATLMPDGSGGCMVEVKATDVFQDINRNWDLEECTPSVKATIAKLTNGVAGTPATSLTLTSADKGGVTARVYLTDGAGNTDFCTVTINVEDNICGASQGSAAVAGAIQTESKATVEGVQVNLSGQTQKSFSTSVNGLFVFNNLTAGADYTVTPSLNKGFLNGVSTFDLVLISKHILGVQPLNTPYKLIAADVNNSKSVTTLDLIQLRKLILNIDATFANNSSWRFVDATYTFPNASNPWAASFPEVKNVNDLVGSLSANFVAVKVGDVNGNAIANSTQGSVRNLTSNLGINVADMNLVAGNEYKVDFTAADLSGVEGFQFTLNLDKKGLELVDLVPGIAAEENFGIFAEEGVVTASWNGEAKGGVLFSLVVRAKSNTTLSEVLNLNSRYTAAEAYKGGEVMNVGLNFNASKASANYELYQNTPNPFAGESIIGFNLPVAGAATLTIQDVTGRTLKVINGQYAKGYNQVSLKSTELSATGVLTYTLKAADFTATRKMIIVE